MRVDLIGTVLFAGALVAAGFWGCDGGDTTGTSGSGGTGGSNPTTTTTMPTTTTTQPTTTTMAGPTTSTTMGPSFLGTECSADADCGMDGKCLTAGADDSVLGGGPANGYCTKNCQTDTDCPGAGSTCLTDQAGKGECFLGCTFGEPALMYLNDPLDGEKCHGREDLRCQTLQDGSNVCLPACGNDDQCAGRACDPRFGVCVTTPSTGKLMGEACDPMSMTEECAGTCIGIQSDAGNLAMCTSLCTMGGEAPNANECNVGVKTPGGLCIYSPSGTGVGDIGFCAQGCTMEDQCQYPAFFCFNVGLPDGGVCLGSKSCAADGECNMLPNGKCIATSVGKFCMSEGYPLGSLTPGMTSSSSSSSSSGSSSSSSTGTGGSGGSGGTGGSMTSSSSTGP